MQSNNAQMLIPNLFPAKLWNLVNHPEVTAIVWDSNGECIEINQELLEKQILSPSTNTLTGCPSFKSISFSSFIRQLYAYGFKKAEHCKRYLVIHHYLHPLFKKNKPELLSLMSRLAIKTRRPPPYFPDILHEKENDDVDAHWRGDNVDGANRPTGKWPLKMGRSGRICHNVFPWSLRLLLFDHEGLVKFPMFLLCLQETIYFSLNLNSSLMRRTPSPASIRSSPGGTMASGPVCPTCSTSL